MSFSYGSRTVLENLSFRVDGSTRVALVGKNGCGKTTLLRLLRKALEPSEGSVEHAKNLRFGACRLLRI